MPRRACLIVLDAAGAGALPDADAYGDAGSSTLQHVADAVGGIVVEQQSPENGLFRLQRMRRQLQCFQLGIVGHGDSSQRNRILLR